LPTVAAVGGLEEDVRSEIKDAGIDGREEERRGAIETVVALAQDDGGNVAGLSGVAVEDGDFAAVDQIGMQGIGRDVAVFFDADGGPIAKGDFAEVAAAGGADGAAFLLASVDPVGKLVVGDDVIELRGGWLYQELQVWPPLTLMVAP